MEEEKKRGREFYQLNLDTGRIFWIAFVLGLIIIGIFIFGFFIGGGEGKKDFLKLGKPHLFQREKVEKVAKEEDLDTLDLFENSLEVETRYIEVESLDEAVIESEKTKLKAQQAAQAGIRKPGEAPTVKVEKGTLQKKKVVTPKKVSVSVPRGDYYIQVASFIKKENATKFADRLRRNMYKVVIEKAVIQDKTYYRVRVGPFATKGIAVNTMTAMKKRFQLEDPFVLKKRS